MSLLLVPQTGTTSVALITPELGKTTSKWKATKTRISKLSQQKR